MANHFTVKYNICKNTACNKEYELGFYGTGPKYCSRKCFFGDKKRLDKIRRDRAKEKFLKATKIKCKLCGRNVVTINGYPTRFDKKKCCENGERKKRYIRKYCSERCMILSQKRSKTGKEAKYFTVRVPIYQLGEMLKT